MRVALRPRSGCLVLCLCLSVFTLLLQSLWVPLDMTKDESSARSTEEQGQRGFDFRRLALRLEVLSTQVQRLSRERDANQLNRDHVSLLLQSFKQDQRGLVQLVERELKRVSQRLDQLSRHHHHHHHHQSHTSSPIRPHTGPNEKCEVPMDPAYPVCAEKVEFLRARWQSDPCYAFYGVNGTTCSILTYLSQIEDFCPPFGVERNHSTLPWHEKPHSYTEKAEIRQTLSHLYEVISNNSSPAIRFIRSRVERMSVWWVQAGLRMRQSNKKTTLTQMRVLVYPGALTGSAGQRFEAMVEKGGPLGELVQWADLSACLTILGHNLMFSTSQHHLHSLIGAAPGQGSCPVQRPLTFDLIYTDYHGLVHLQGAMGLAFQHYKCRFRILDSFGTEPAFNLESYAHSKGFKTLWGSWGLQPLQYMTMFPHTPDNSFLGFVSEEAVREVELAPDTLRKDRIAVVYGKQDYMWQGKSEYVNMVSEELETHATVYQPPGHASNLPSFITNHGLLTQDRFLRLLRRAKVFVGLGFPYEGPAPIEAVALGCVFLQPRFNPPHSSDNNDFYKGKPTTRQISSQHPYAEEFIGKPHVWTVDMTNRTEVQEALKAILRTKVNPYTPRELTCEGMLERVQAYIRHQDFCSTTVPKWPPESALHLHLGPLGQSCVSVCRRSSLVCEPALFHHLNSPATFTRLGLSCSSMVQKVNHLFPAYSPWGRHCVLQQEPLLFSCAGSDPSQRRLCPCRAHIPGQVSLCPECL